MLANSLQVLHAKQKNAATDPRWRLVALWNSHEYSCIHHFVAHFCGILSVSARCPHVPMANSGCFLAIAAEMDSTDRQMCSICKSELRSDTRASVIHVSTSPNLSIKREKSVRRCRLAFLLDVKVDQSVHLLHKQHAFRQMIVEMRWLAGEWQKQRAPTRSKVCLRMKLTRLIRPLHRADCSGNDELRIFFSTVVVFSPHLIDAAVQPLLHQH